MIGDAPKSAKVGDMVVVLSGAFRPSFVRRHGDGYLFLGNGYVRGIMHGEHSDRDDMSEEVIKIV